MARRLGDEGTLAHALSRANFVDITPEAARNGVEANTEVIGLARKLGDRELEVRSHVLRLNNHLALGDIPAVDRDLDTYVRLATELRQPTYLWHIPILRGMRAMIDGRFEEAEELALEARAGGRARRRAPGAAVLRDAGADHLPPAGPLGRDRRDASPTWPSATRRCAPGASPRPPILADLGRLDEARDRVRAARRGRLRGHPPGRAMGDLPRAADRRRRRASATPSGPGSCASASPRTAGWSSSPVARPPPAARSPATSAWPPRPPGTPRPPIADYEEAIAMSRSMGDRPFTAESAIELARVLLGRGGARRRRAGRGAARPLARRRPEAADGGNLGAGAGAEARGPGAERDRRRGHDRGRDRRGRAGAPRRPLLRRSRRQRDDPVQRHRELDRDDRAPRRRALARGPA